MSTPGVTIYSTKWCGSCRTLKMFLHQHGVRFEEVDIEEHPEYGPLLEGLTGGYRTVPTIQVGDQYYVNPGGYELHRVLGLETGRTG